MAARLNAEFWAICNRLEELAEVLIWEADESEVAPAPSNVWADILRDPAACMSEFARKKIEMLCAHHAATSFEVAA